MKLLCATDLLPRSDFAIERAGWLAEELRAELSLLHVVRPAESEGALEQALRTAIAQLTSRARPPTWRRDLSPDLVVRPGNPVRIITDSVQRHLTNLLVLGPHRKRGMLEAFEGSIADKVVRSRICPVLIVQRAPQGSYKRIVFGLDTCAPSIAALEVGEQLVLRADAAATVAHAYEPAVRGMLGNVSGNGPGAGSEPEEGERHAAICAIRDMLKSRSRDLSRFDIRASEGLPAPEIVRAAEAVDADLIVVGTRAPGRVHRALTGSVANQVIRKAACDVLVVSESPATLTGMRADRYGSNVHSQPRRLNQR
jgi:nucleotide-binding universal stress UspA family protein